MGNLVVAAFFYVMKISDELKGYSKEILNHFLNPKNIGSLDNPTLIINSTSPFCNDISKFYIELSSDVIIRVRIKVFGCTIAIAAASVTSEYISNKRSSEIANITEQTLESMIKSKLPGIPQDRIKCIYTSVDTIKQLKDQLSQL